MRDRERYEQIVTGHVVIDQQHAQLYRLVDRLSDLAEDMGDTTEVADFIYGILRYAATHFREEEAMMLECGYDGLERQRQAHSAFADDVRSMADQHRSEASPSARELHDFMRRWMDEHVEQEDLAMAEFIRNRDCPDRARGVSGSEVPPYYP